MALVAENKIFTYGDLSNWPETERWELVYGEALAMSAPTRKHQAVAGQIFRKLANFLENKKCKVYISPFDVRFPEKNEKDEEIITVLQPDILVVCDENKLDKKGCRGAPDIIFEVLSPETAKYDQTTKMKIYEKAGVKEYWILHPEDQVAFQWKLEEEKYRKTTVFSNEDSPALHIFPEYFLPLGEIFAAE